jgi:hypothetical protein
VARINRPLRCWEKVASWLNFHNGNEPPSGWLNAKQMHRTWHLVPFLKLRLEFKVRRKKKGNYIGMKLLTQVYIHELARVNIWAPGLGKFKGKWTEFIIEMNVNRTDGAERICNRFSHWIIHDLAVVTDSGGGGKESIWASFWGCVLALQVHIDWGYISLLLQCICGMVLHSVPPQHGLGNDGWCVWKGRSA